MLKVQGLRKNFDRKEVLKGINFQLEEGEILAILGRSGAGKTSLLRCVNGLEKSDGGTIEIEGISLCREENKKMVYASQKEKQIIRKKIGMVFQNFNLFPHMSILENIMEAPVNILGISKEEARAKAMELLRMMELADKANAYHFEISGGQKQRAAIARACALEPKIMCFDEPTSALDPELTEGIASILEGLAQNGMAVLVITHDMAFAKRVANRVIFMEEGEVIEDTEKDTFFNHVGNEKVRRFITA